MKAFPSPFLPKNPPRFLGRKTGLPLPWQEPRKGGNCGRSAVPAGLAGIFPQQRHPVHLHPHGIDADGDPGPGAGQLQQNGRQNVAPPLGAAPAGAGQPQLPAGPGAVVADAAAFAEKRRTAYCTAAGSRSQGTPEWKVKSGAMAISQARELQVIFIACTSCTAVCGQSGPGWAAALVKPGAGNKKALRSARQNQCKQPHYGALVPWQNNNFTNTKCAFIQDTRKGAKPRPQPMGAA